MYFRDDRNDSNANETMKQRLVDETRVHMSQ
jgi:hypothetical protein